MEKAVCIAKDEAQARQIADALRAAGVSSSEFYKQKVAGQAKVTISVCADHERTEAAREVFGRIGAEMRENGESQGNAKTDLAGWEAAREYDRDASSFSEKESEEAARRAENALDGPEKEELREAERFGKAHSQARSGQSVHNQTGGMENADREKTPRRPDLERKAHEAEEALEGPEGESLRRAEEIGKSRSKGDEPRK